MIQLIGPGGAGKTTIGAALAERLDVRFADLDGEFTAWHGDISTFLGAHGYQAYARQNVDVYLALVGAPIRPEIVSLSSGFMTYPLGIHPEYLTVRERIASSLSTFVLLPSVDLETCVSEIVRRQLRRPFARPAEREERVIRERYFTYARLRPRKLDTLQTIDTVVEELISKLGGAETQDDISRRIASRCLRVKDS